LLIPWTLQIAPPTVTLKLGSEFVGKPDPFTVITSPPKELAVVGVELEILMGKLNWVRFEGYEQSPVSVVRIGIYFPPIAVWGTVQVKVWVTFEKLILV